MPEGKTQTVKHGNLQWIDVQHPDAVSLAKLGKKFKFHPLDIEDCLSEVELQRPKIDEYDDYLFIILHFPVLNRRTKRIEQSEVNIFVGQNYFVTIHRDYRPMTELFDRVKKKNKSRDDYMGKGAGYLLYMIIDDLFDAAFPLAERLMLNVSSMEKDVFDLENSRDRLKEILLTKKDIINFRRILLPQRTSIAQLEHKNKKFRPEDLDVYFEDIVDKIERLYSSVENLFDLIESLQDTNESIISHNTNNIIRVLTIFSVILLPLNLVAGFYGMNISGLPLAEHSQASIILAGIMFLVALSMIVYFRFKKWL